MEAAYDPAAWEAFAVGVVGGAAALAGLLVVAASINMSRIMESTVVLNGLSLTLALFALVLVTGVILLTPGQSPRFAGVAIAVAGVLAAAAMVLTRRRPAGGEHGVYSVSTIALSLFDAGLFVMAGIGCAVGAAGGLYWMVPGTILAFVVGLVNAWVDLVEVLR